MPSEICNLKVEEKLTKDGKQLLFFFTKKVHKNQEVFFDYGKEFNLSWKIDFDKIVKKSLENIKAKDKRNFIEKKV